MRILSKKGVLGIHLCGEDYLTEVLSYCFSGVEMKLLSVNPEKDLLDNPEQRAKPVQINMKWLHQALSNLKVVS